MKLFRLETVGLGDYWVIANDPTEAEIALGKILDGSNYGFYEKRTVKTINYIAESIDNLTFVSGKKLIINIPVK